MYVFSKLIKIYKQGSLLYPIDVSGFSLIILLLVNKERKLVLIADVKIELAEDGTIKGLFKYI